MNTSKNIQDLAELASSQWGLFTTAQAAVLGVGRTQIARMANSGAVECMRRGTYRFTIGEETAHASIKAAWLSAYPKLTAAERLRTRPLDAVVAGVTAASLHGIGDFHEDPYTFIVLRRRQTNAADLSFHTWTLDDTDVTFVGTLPVTTMERTIADLVRERHDPEHIERATRDAIYRGANAYRIEELLNTLRTRPTISIDFLLPIIDKGKDRKEKLDSIIAEMGVLEAYFRSLKTPRELESRGSSLTDIVAMTKRLERTTPHPAPPDLVDAIRSLSDSVQLLVEKSDKGQ